MVLVTVGSTHYGFSRLIREVDRLAGAGFLSEVTAQIGTSQYVPRHCGWNRFISSSELWRLIEVADFVICHAGCGTLEECLRAGKKMIVVPRRARDGEAPDDHQMEIVDVLESANRVLVVHEVADLLQKVQQVISWQPRLKVAQNRSLMLEHISTFIEQSFGASGRAVPS